MLHRTGRPRLAALAVGLVLGGGVLAALPADDPPPLAATLHPPVSRDSRLLWVAPSRRSVDAASERLKSGLAALEAGRLAEAREQLQSVASSDHPLADYAAYYLASAAFEAKALDEANDRLRRVRRHNLTGALAEQAARLHAAVAEARNDGAEAAAAYEDLLRLHPDDADAVWMRLGRVLDTHRLDWARAAEAYARVYYEFPLSPLASEARQALDRLNALEPLEPDSVRFRADLRRAERLFQAGRYTDARVAFAELGPFAKGDDRYLVALRAGAADMRRRQFGAATTTLESLTQDGPYRDEARYYLTLARRDRGRTQEYARSVAELRDRYPESAWTARALDDLATHYIRADEDDTADTVLRELYARFPDGPYAERAAWKVGWRAYREGRYRDTAAFFDDAARRFPRGDRRPAFLYWTGRALESHGDDGAAAVRYQLATADYLNTYYGRLARGRLSSLGRSTAETRLQFGTVPASSLEDGEIALPPTYDRIRRLLAAGLYDDAVRELQFVRRVLDRQADAEPEDWARHSAVVDATLAWTYSQVGRYREAIVAMKRAYPQYMASGGQWLPAEVLTVIFPLPHRTEIEQAAERRRLNPYLVAGLVAQESAFDPAIRSSANAVGLMQLLPSTAREYVRTLGLGTYRSSMLTTPRTNLALGTAFLADLVERFGQPHLAVAAYNAGGSRVAGWVRERANDRLSPEEFIDDIPYPETQAYVKKVLSLSETYRQLYGSR